MRRDPAPLGRLTRSAHGPRNFLKCAFTSVDPVRRHDKGNADPGPRCPDPGPVPPVRFGGNRARGPRATCYRLRQTLEVNSRGRFSALSREPLGKPRKHWGAYATPGRIGSAKAPHAKNQKLTAAE